ncbi:hypothetical protein L1987_20751 [Smallanthus sonchifolius]|uniref:Uncharacterized protein n=1 Tax=Smallanthus sonchifolius TaxID=185202 RepID=A0ACB9IUD1_9ASTR|nr:hypothetical protein L1987_20751 [Smallanthus sonchifolius]
MTGCLFGLWSPTIEMSSSFRSPTIEEFICLKYCGVHITLGPHVSKDSLGGNNSTIMIGNFIFTEAKALSSSFCNGC